MRGVVMRGDEFMSEANEVNALFARNYFGPPCTVSDIERAEAVLREPLPTAIRELYLAFNGFLGPTDARFFWTLFGRNGLVEMNQFIRGEDMLPQALVGKCPFFGSDGCGTHWGFKQDLPDRIIRWDAEWEDSEIVGDKPLAVWRAAKQLYDSLREKS